MTIPGKYTKISIHVLAWLLAVLMPGIQVGNILGTSLPPAYWIRQFILLCLLIPYFYGNLKFLTPTFLLNHKRGRFMLIHLGIIVSLQVVNGVIDALIDVRGAMIRTISQSLSIDLSGNKWLLADFNLFLTSVVVAGISTSLVVVQEWRVNLNISKQIKEKQVAAELALLKAQIHPHFFFNTLNNIYSLSYEKVEDARTSIYKLSRMMRYLLYETPNNLTSLGKEINFVKDYMELMKLRMTDSMVIHFEVPPTVVEYPISPMILLPFIENAFKHGVSSLVDGTIVVRITQVDRRISLYVENTIIKEDVNSPMEAGGIGLTNTKRRLQMLYPHSHTLRHGRSDDNSYIVELDILL